VAATPLSANGPQLTQGAGETSNARTTSAPGILDYVVRAQTVSDGMALLGLLYVPEAAPQIFLTKGLECSFLALMI
ncbi:MAG: hypothetical protein ACRDEA_17080, partial [Microcystaceae cyanobacterium]